VSFSPIYTSFKDIVIWTVKHIIDAQKCRFKFNFLIKNSYISLTLLLIESALPRLSRADKIKKDAIVKSDSKQALLLRLLDNTNIKIVSQIIENPDIGSLTLSKKFNIPLSTIQRRRAKIEKDVLKKTYTLDYKALGCRLGDLIVNVENGKAEEVAHKIINKYKTNVKQCQIRINSIHNIIAQIIYKNSNELNYLIEGIKAMDYVITVEWSEMVKTIGDNDSGIVQSVLKQ
jgi:DNA-binding Lrp family transcriptional regulator